VGYSNDPQRRVLEHNTKPFNTYTSKQRPWRLVAAFECGYDEKKAIQIELFIKKAKEPEANTNDDFRQPFDRNFLNGVVHIKFLRCIVPELLSWPLSALQE